MMQPKDEKTIHASPTSGTYAAIAARLDAQNRSNEAADANPDFFLSTDHQHRIDEVQAIVTGFLTSRKGVYINHRQNRTRPFTVVKMDGVRWPAKATRAQAKKDFYEPLEKLGVAPVFSAQTNSYLFRIY